MPITINKTFVFSEHDAPVYGLEVFGDSAFFSGGGDRIVSCRNTTENSVAKGIVNTGSTIYSLKFISEKNILLAGVSGGGMHVVDLNKKKEIHFLLNHEKGIFDIKYSLKHDKIITAGGDGKISLWSGKDFSFLKSISFCKEKIRAIAFDQNENIAAIGCGDGTIHFIRIDDSTEIHSFTAHQFSVNAIYFHPVLNILISGGKDAHLKFWNSENFELVKSIPAHNYAIYSISFSPDGNYFATGSRDKTIKIWSAETFNLLTRIDHEKNSGHIHSVNKILWMNEALLSAGDDKKIIGWKVSN